jgi:hypothetical protein
MAQKLMGLCLFIGICTALLLCTMYRAHKLRYPVQSIRSFEEAQEILDSCSLGTLILFDVDDTLISASDFLVGKGIGGTPWWFRLQICLRHPTLLNPKIWEHVYSIMWQKAHRELIEPSIADTIVALQQKGCTVLGLTSMESGSYGVIPNFPLWRYEMLAKMGITFTSIYDNTTFTKLPTYRGTQPILYNGILCCNQQSKGDVLDAFLNYYDLSPQHIIFFDDEIANLQSVGAACSKHHILCTLFKYDGYQKIIDTWDTKRAMEQIDILVATGHWIQ